MNNKLVWQVPLPRHMGGQVDEFGYYGFGYYIRFT